MIAKINANEDEYIKYGHIDQLDKELEDLNIIGKSHNDYKELNEYYLIVKENKNYNFFLEENEKIIEIGPGFSFGDFALESTNRLRTATIKIESNCYFAVISQEDYGNYLLKEKKISKMKELKFLHEGFFNKMLDKEKFDKHYFYEFRFEEYPIGHVIDLESSPSNNTKKRNDSNNNGDNNNINDVCSFNNYVSSLYLIKEGQIEIRLNKNLVELFQIIITLVDRDFLFDSVFDLITYTKYFKKKTKMNLKEFLKKKSFSIMKIGVNDILGVEEFYFKLPFLFQAKDVSEKVSLYKVSEESLNKIMNKEGKTKEFMKENALVKLNNKILRLINLHTNHLKIMEKQTLDFNKICEKKTQIKNKAKGQIIIGQSEVSEVKKIKMNFNIKKVDVDLNNNFNTVLTKKDYNNLITSSSPEVKLTYGVRKLKFKKSQNHYADFNLDFQSEKNCYKEKVIREEEKPELMMSSTFQHGFNNLNIKEIGKSQIQNKVKSLINSKQKSKSFYIK